MGEVGVYDVDIEDYEAVRVVNVVRVLEDDRVDDDVMAEDVVGVHEDVRIVDTVGVGVHDDVVFIHDVHLFLDPFGGNYSSP